MNRNLRIINTFRFDKIDRFPLFEQAVSGAVVSKILGRKALGFATDLHFGEANALFQGEHAYEDFIGNFKQDYYDFVNALDLDMVAVPWFLWKKPSEKLDNFTFKYEDKYGWEIRRYDPSSSTFGVMQTSWDDCDTDRLKSYIKELIKDFSPNLIIPQKYFNLLKWFMEKLGKDRCVAGASAFAVPMHPVWWMLLIEEPNIIADYLDLILESERHLADSQSRYNIRVINGGGDLAINKGPVYSPKIFREIVFPRIKKIIEYYHSKNMLYIFRTDGNIWSIADELLKESGTDGYGEIDIDAGMDFVKLRRTYPNLVLWGGLSCGSLLINGTKEQIETEAKRLCEFFSTHQGWIAGSSNTLLSKTNIDGYFAALEIIKNFKLA